MTFLELAAVKKLQSLKLPDHSYVIAGTGIMFALGIRPLEDFTDIDLYATGEAFNILSKCADKKDFDNEWQSNHVVLFNGEIEAYANWGPRGFDAQRTLVTPELHFGLPFWDLNTLLSWKKLMNRPKDTKHIQLIKEYLKRSINQ